MTETQLINCPDHRVWADEFCSRAVAKGFDPADEDDKDWLAVWFANAMMNGYDRASRIAPQ